MKKRDRLAKKRRARFYQRADQAERCYRDRHDWAWQWVQLAAWRAARLVVDHARWANDLACRIGLEKPPSCEVSVGQ